MSEPLEIPNPACQVYSGVTADKIFIYRGKFLVSTVYQLRRDNQYIRTIAREVAWMCHCRHRDPFQK